VRAVLGLAVAAVLWLGAHGLRTEAVAARAAWPRSATMLVVPPVEVVRFAPYRELLADLLWCRLLVYYGSNWGGDGDLSQVEDLLDDIIALDPRFKTVYEWAAFAVAYRTGRANQAEFRSSIHYLEEGMRQFPDDYRYPWIAGTRYYFDMWSADEKTLRRYRERGAALIEEAMTKPNAPQDLATTAANMRSKLGQQERALDSLRQMILSTSDEGARQKMLRRLRVSDPGLADELTQAAADIEEDWLGHMPMVPLDFFLLLGDRPSPVIDLRKLATPRDLFGAEKPVDEN
jgi:tetratricopeptide (TPR) repeat protein